MAVLTLQDITPAGIGPTYVAAAGGGNTFANNGRVMLHVRNAGGASITATIVSARTCNFGFQHDLAVVVPNGGERMIGPFPIERFNNDAGMVAVTYSGVTSVTVGVFEL
jgi:hypothetical protein